MCLNKHCVVLRRPLNAVAIIDVLFDEYAEIICNAGAAERHLFLAVDKDRRGGFLAATGQADADIRVLGFARPVHDAAHHGNIQFFHTRVLLPPFGHAFADMALDFLG